MDIEKHDNRGNMSYTGEEMKIFEVEGTIPTKYRGMSEITMLISYRSLSTSTNTIGLPGTNADQRDMAMLGKKQVLRVRDDKTPFLRRNAS